MTDSSRTPLALVAAASLLASAAFSTAPRGDELLLLNATIIDGTGSDARPGMSILLRDGHIARIAPAAELPRGEIASIDLEGRWLLPGFIDAHAHIASPMAAERALLSGVTTVRVLGDAYLRGLGTRDLVAGGFVRGPEMLVSGAIVRPVLGEPVINAFPQFGRYLDEPLEGAENVSEVVRALLDRGVDVIKVGASERAGLMSTDPRRTELDEDEIRAAVYEAGRAGKFVAAHAHAATGVHAAVLAGVRSIEHGTYTRDDTLALMRERGTYFVPTLAVMSPLADPLGLSADAIDMHLRIWHMQTALQGAVRKAHAMGIAIATATDGSYAEGEETDRIRVQHEIEQLIALDFTVVEAITAATVTAARLLGVDERTGRIAEGLEGDLLVFDRDPQLDPRVLYEPLLIVNNGVVELDRLYGVAR